MLYSSISGIKKVHIFLKTTELMKSLEFLIIMLKIVEDFLPVCNKCLLHFSVQSNVTPKSIIL